MKKMVERREKRAQTTKKNGEKGQTPTSNIKHRDTMMLGHVLIQTQAKTRMTHQGFLWNFKQSDASKVATQKHFCLHNTSIITK